jgi:flagellar hook-associated protein 1 FlgK
MPVLGSANNTASGSPTLTLTDAGNLEASDYELRFDGTNWSLRRLADGQQLASLAPGSQFAFDGLALDLSGIAGAATGDRYLLRPMRVAAGLEVMISNPRAIAAALPVRAEASPGNIAGATIEDLSVTDVTDPQLRSPVTIQYSGGNFVAGAVSVPLDPSGDTVIDINGWQFTVRGTPADGDTFTVGDNTGGIGDNRNALKLAGIADSNLMNGGTTTLGETYAEMVADIGVKTRRAQINAQVQGQLLGEAQARRESVSGVNLDEEAANLIRFQQAYEASAQVIAAAGTMFDSLLAAVRR